LNLLVAQYSTSTSQVVAKSGDFFERPRGPWVAADEYARLKGQTVSSGIQLSESDLWIVATATVVGASLVTSDADFARVPGLIVDDWTKLEAQ
jgi:predicted nucleic acid-binding protein